jgi:hypothetical protein
MGLAGKENLGDQACECSSGKTFHLAFWETDGVAVTHREREYWPGVGDLSSAQDLGFSGDRQIDNKAKSHRVSSAPRRHSM